MNSVTHFVGLDYHQSGIQVCIMGDGGEILSNTKVENSIQAVMRVVQKSASGDETTLKNDCVVAVAIEACCGAADLADELIETAGWSVSLAHPGFVSRMKQSPDKTDWSDARLLADLLRVDYLPKVWLAPEEIRRLRRLVRYREQLVDQRRNVKLRIRALLRDNRLRCPSDANAWTKPWRRWIAETDELVADDRWLMDQHLGELALLDEKVKEAEQRLEERAKNDAMIGRLMMLPGVGLITATTIRAEIGRFDRFQSGKQLSRFCGLSPRNASSGERQADSGLIKAGAPQLRRVLIQLGHRLVSRINGPWSDLAVRLARNGKPKNVIVAAVANRYMRWLFHQMQPEKLMTNTC